MPTVAYKQRRVKDAHEERALGINNLSTSEHDQITGTMFECGFWVSLNRQKVDEYANKISKLLENHNIREYAPRLTMALDSLQTILEHTDIAHGIALEY